MRRLAWLAAGVVLGAAAVHVVAVVIFNRWLDELDREMGVL